MESKILTDARQSGLLVCLGHLDLEANLDDEQQEAGRCVRCGNLLVQAPRP